MKSLPWTEITENIAIKINTLVKSYFVAGGWMKRHRLDAEDDDHAFKRLKLAMAEEESAATKAELAANAVNECRFAIFQEFADNTGHVRATAVWQKQLEALLLSSTTATTTTSKVEPSQKTSCESCQEQALVCLTVLLPPLAKLVWDYTGDDYFPPSYKAWTHSWDLIKPITSGTNNNYSVQI